MSNSSFWKIIRSSFDIIELFDELNAKRLIGDSNRSSRSVISDTAGDTVDWTVVIGNTAVVFLIPPVIHLIERSSSVIRLLWFLIPPVIHFWTVVIGNTAVVKIKNSIITLLDHRHEVLKNPKNSLVYYIHDICLPLPLYF